MARPELRPIRPERVRKLSFKRGISIGWIDNRVKSPEFGFLAEMQRREKNCWALYAFLCSSVDSNGLCKYSIRKIAQALQKGYNSIIAAKNVLEEMDLIATRAIPEERNLTLWQVLTLPIVEGHYKARVTKRSAQGDGELMDQMARLMVEKFYTKIGQSHVSSAKLTQGIKVVKRLIDDGFKINDIDTAIDWSVKNVPNVHSFGIVEETIGQAQPAKARAEEDEAAAAVVQSFRDGDRVRLGRKRGTVEGRVVRFDDDDSVSFLRRVAGDLKKI